MKQLYVADPSEHNFLVTSANSPSTISNIFSSVLGLFPRFSNRQNNTNKHKDEDQKQSATKASTIETIHTTNGNIGMNISTSAETIQDVSDLANLSADISIHHDVCDTPSHHGDLFQNSTCNEMLTHYRRIVIGCFKDFFQSVNTNNLAEVLQALKELNFVLANRALELAAHYNMMLELCQISAEEVPELVKAHLHHATAYNPQHSIRGRPHSRGNQYHWYNRQSSPLPRYNEQAQRSDAHFHPHPNRNYSYTHYHNNSKHNSPHPVRHSHNTSNSQGNASNAQSPNASRFNRLFAKSNSRTPNTSTTTNYIEFNQDIRWQQEEQFTSWAQSVENTARLCNLDTLSIALSKLQGTCSSQLVI